jgi:hypothetical protein
MGILHFLKQSVKGETLKFVSDWEERRSRYVFPEFERVNDFFKSLPAEQLEILKKKFNGLNDVFDLHNYLAEIVVAEKYSEDTPVFIAESRQKTPDIYLEKKKEFVEVKVIAPSNEYKKWEEMMDKMKSWSGNAKMRTKEEMKSEYLPYLTRKAKEKIDDGINQLGSRNGFIYLLYRIDNDLFDTDGNDRHIMLWGQDINGTIFSHKDFLGQELEKWVSEYALEKNIRVLCEQYKLLHHAEVSKQTH